MRALCAAVIPRQNLAVPDAALQQEAESAASRRHFAIILLAATVLGAGLRLYGLGSASFWEDELKTVRYCGRLVEVNRTKVLGYAPTAVGLWLQGVRPGDIPVEHPERWQALGITESRTRLASAVIGIISIPCLGLAVYPMMGARAAGLFACFLAIAPWHLYWSQAARFYSQQFLFYSLCLIWYYQATQTGSRLRMIGAVVMLMLAFLTQPPALVAIVVLAGDFLWGRIRREPVCPGRAGWIGIPAVLAACLLVLRLDVHDRRDQWSQFLGDMYQSPGRMVLGSAYLILPAVVLFAAMSAPLILSIRPRLGAYLMLAAVAPIAVFAAASTESYVGLRYAFVSLFGWLALAALGSGMVYDALRPCVGRMLALAPAGVLLASMAFADYAYYTTGYGYHERWREAFAFVERNRRPGDIVYVPASGRNDEGRPISLVGPYYLRDGGVVRGMPRPEELGGTGRPAWVVVEARDPFGQRRHAWLDEVMRLEAYFSLQVIQPSSAVHVYRYEPAFMPAQVGGGS